MFRSEEVVRCQLFIQPEASYSTVALLGEAGVVQFTDMNQHLSLFQRKFVGEVRRCDELERKLRYIEAELKKDGLFVSGVPSPVGAPQPREIIEIETLLERAEGGLAELSRNAANLKANFVEMTEMKLVVETASVFLVEEALQRVQQEEADPARTLLVGPGAEAEDPAQHLGFVAGVVARERVAALERMLWRISRGNVFVRLAEQAVSLEDPATGEQVHKTAFVAFFQGDNLKVGIRKVCAGFRANTYPCPGSAQERVEVVRTLRTRLADIVLILGQTRLHRQRVLDTVRRDLREWSAKVLKMKAIYYTLNMFDMDVSNKCLIAEGWVPVNDIPHLRQALHAGGKTQAGDSIPSFLNIIQTPECPPTFIRSNKFTGAFQELINAYAIPSYKELNPGLYTIVTFPFLFSVMFGDLGHGIIVTLFALYMVLNESKFEKSGGGGEIWKIMFGGRYIILMMGIFAMHAGIIYNDVFSVSLSVFKSSWKPNYNMSTLMHNNHLELDPATRAYSQQPYPFGLDPVWQNKIVFLNTFKMKFSIIIGVLHMMLGLSLRCINLVNKRNWFSLVFEFVPQIMFLVLLFGYFASLMIAKWIMYKSTSDPSQQQSSSSCAPNVLITFINMVMMSEERAAPGCSKWMYGGQGTLQRALLVSALLCVPVLLLAKPLRAVLAARAARTANSYTATGSWRGRSISWPSAQEDDEYAEEQDNGAQEEAGQQRLSEQRGSRGSAQKDVDEPLSEVVVHEVIHTIEYVLSTVSHTASYLRLWALSLAHAQLSEVLWGMVLRRALLAGAGPGRGVLAAFPGALVMVLIFPAWAALTVAILVLMEGLSAFLHTLRLHWVEFMSKFYEGAGRAFLPFSFKAFSEAARAAAEP